MIFARGCAEETPNILDLKCLILHQDNAPAHIPLSVNRYLASHGWSVVPHPLLFARPSPVRLFSVSQKKENSKTEAC